MVTGEVEEPLTLTWEELLALPATEVTADIHCVTRWSRFDVTFRGVHWRELAARVGPKPRARFVVAHSEHDYTANLPLDAIELDDSLIAYEADGAPLTPDHGWPLRLVVPTRYFWKSAKWLRGLELASADRPGVLGALRLPQRRPPVCRRALRVLESRRARARRSRRNDSPCGSARGRRGAAAPEDTQADRCRKGGPGHRLGRRGRCPSWAWSSSCVSRATSSARSGRREPDSCCCRVVAHAARVGSGERGSAVTLGPGAVGTTLRRAVAASSGVDRSGHQLTFIVSRTVRLSSGSPSSRSRAFASSGARSK